MRKLKIVHILLIACIAAYTAYFSLYTLLRHDKLYSHYFDLGIMDQTVHNSYMALRTGDWGRLLEMTDPHDTALQVKRMSVHNDILLALLAPLYFIHDGPETLLVTQTVLLAFGAFLLFEIASRVLKHDWLSLLFALCYLMYPAIQRANVFEFHAVTLAAPLLFGLYLLWLQQRYIWSGLMAFLVLLAKEQAGMTVAMFGLFVLFDTEKSSKYTFVRIIWRHIYQMAEHFVFFRYSQSKESYLNLINVLRTFLSVTAERKYAVILICGGIIWSLVSLVIIIPFFRGGSHFGADYYSYLLSEPYEAFPTLLRSQTQNHLLSMLGPLAFLPLISPLHLFIVLPEWALIIFSHNDNMQSIYFHYNTILTPFLFIAAVYGVRNIISRRFVILDSHIGQKQVIILLSSVIVVATLLGSYYLSPLQWAAHPELDPWNAHPVQINDVKLWQKTLSNEQIRVSATGHLAPHFSSRRFFYDFSWKYEFADFVIVDRDEAISGYSKQYSAPAYKVLTNDWRYTRIYDTHGLEVYKRTVRL